MKCLSLAVFVWIFFLASCTGEPLKQKNNGEVIQNQQANQNQPVIQPKEDRLVQSWPKERPEWLVKTPENKDGKMFFVGISQKFSTEQDCRKNAEQNAREQISSFISTEVSAQFQKIATTFGLSSEVFDPTAAAREFAQQTTESVVKFARATETYTEQWTSRLGETYYVVWSLVSVPEQSIADALRMQEEKMKALALKQADEYLAKQIQDADSQIDNCCVLVGDMKLDEAKTLLSKVEAALKFQESSHRRCHAECDMIANMIPARLGKIGEVRELIKFEYDHNNEHQKLLNEFETAIGRFRADVTNPNADQMAIESEIKAFYQSATDRILQHRDSFKHCKSRCGEDLIKVIEAIPSMMPDSLEKAVMNLVTQTFSSVTGSRKVVFTSLMLIENDEEKNKINPKLERSFAEIASDSARRKFGDKVTFLDKSMINVRVPSRSALAKLTTDQLMGADAVLLADAYRMTNDNVKLVMKLLEVGTGKVLGSGQYTINKTALNFPLEVENSALLARIEKEFEDIIPKKPDFKLEIWSDRGDDATYFEGEEVTFNVVSEKDAYIYLFHCDSEGNAQLLYPSSKGDDNYVKAGKVCVIPPPSWGFKLEAGEPFGAEYLIAVASQNKIEDLEKLVKSAKGNFYKFGKIGQDDYSARDWGTRGLPTKIKGGVAKLIVRTQKEK